jgi:hypothetical protein
VGPAGVVVLDPFPDGHASVVEVLEKRLIERLVAHPPVKALDEGVLGLLAVNQHPVAAQQDVQTAVSEPSSLLRTNAQLIAQIAIISAPESIADARAIYIDDVARPLLADIKQSLKVRARLTAGPSDPRYQASRPSAAASGVRYRPLGREAASPPTPLACAQYQPSSHLPPLTAAPR